MKTKYFNAVISRPSAKKPYINDVYGFVIMPDALWAKEEIIDYFVKERINGNDLNKTFHKSWEKIKNSSRGELLIEQIIHYLSTYGTEFQGDVYIPDEILQIPSLKVIFKVIKGYSKEEIQEKCLSMLKSGIALQTETIDDMIEILLNTGYKFTGQEGIKNREAIIKIAEISNILPNDPVEILRYIIYKSTADTLLINNKELINKIKQSKYNPSLLFNKYEKEMAEIFNRFKPLFLAYKSNSRNNQ